MQKKTMLLAAAVTATLTFGATAQAENFFVGLLRSSGWQLPKCTAPEVLTQFNDRRGNIVFRCVKPTTR